MSLRVLRRLRTLRYVTVVPVFLAYRGKAARSLRWRLAGYNLLTLLAGLATALILVGLLASAGASARDFPREEPADDARAAAGLLISSGLVRPGEKVDQAALQPMLTALASGQVPLYRGPNPSQFDVRPRQYLLGVSEVRVLAVPVASSHDPAAQAVITSAASGETNLRANSVLRDGGAGGGIGVYPLVGDDGSVFAVVVVEKAEIQAPSGWAVVRAEIRPVIGSVWVGSVVAALPGLAVAGLLAIVAARSIGGRVRDLSVAAEALARGSLDSRVDVRGEDEVASLGASFNVMAGRLEGAMTSLAEERGRAIALLDANRQLVANVSHELRTPVAVMRGQVEAIDEDMPGNTRIEMVLREIDRLEGLVTDLFVLASAEAAADAPELQQLELQGLIASAVAPLIEPAWRESHVTVISEAVSGRIVVSTDPDRLASAVQNLLRNAIRHTPPGGLVRVFVNADERFGTVQVSDTGTGIPPGDLPHVFERFYRGDASRSRDSGGAGLGLAIAKEFIEFSGGAIEVGSPPDEGATFTIRIPLAN